MKSFVAIPKDIETTRAWLPILPMLWYLFSLADALAMITSLGNGAVSPIAVLVSWQEICA